MDLIHVLGGGLEPPRLTAYAPQTYVSAISPPERCGGTELVSRTIFLASVSSGELGTKKVRSCRSSGVQELQNRTIARIGCNEKFDVASSHRSEIRSNSPI